MKIPSTLHIFAQLVGATALVAAAHAAAWNEQVTNACTQKGLNVSAEEKAICQAYMEGFLDGAIITDTAMIQPVTEADSDKSSFFKRAYATRVGSSSRTLPATTLAHFCLPDGMERTQVVSAITNAIPGEPQPGSDVAQSLYNILKASYPCNE